MQLRAMLTCQNSAAFAKGNNVVKVDENGSSGYIEPAHQILGAPPSSHGEVPVCGRDMSQRWTRHAIVVDIVNESGGSQYYLEGDSIAIQQQLIRAVPSSWIASRGTLNARSGDQIRFEGGPYAGREGYLWLRYEHEQVRLGVELFKVDDQSFPKRDRQRDSLQQLRPEELADMRSGWFPQASP